MRVLFENTCLRFTRFTSHTRFTSSSSARLRLLIQPPCAVFSPPALLYSEVFQRPHLRRRRRQRPARQPWLLRQMLRPASLRRVHPPSPLPRAAGRFRQLLGRGGGRVGGAGGAGRCFCRRFSGSRAAGYRLAVPPAVAAHAARSTKIFFCPSSRASHSPATDLRPSSLRHKL